MAVPKKKISKSKGGMRRGGNGGNKVSLLNVVIDKTTGEYKLPHHISIDGFYKGKKIVADKKKKDNTEKTEVKKSEKKVVKATDKTEDKK